MRFRPKLGLILSGVCLGLCAISHASAATMTYGGSLGSDDQSQFYAYNLAQDSNVVFMTTSYAKGGFVPVISLFDSTGTVVGSDGGDASCHGGMSMMDATTSMCDDAYLTENLKAGAYTLAVTEFFNVPVGPNLSDGFLMQGQGDYTGVTCGATGSFYQTDVAPCVQRTSSFALTATATPEPSALWLGGIPLVLFGLARSRRAKQVVS